MSLVGGQQCGEVDISLRRGKRCVCWEGGGVAPLLIIEGGGGGG